MNRFLRQSAFFEGANLQADCPKTARGSPLEAGSFLVNETVFLMVPKLIKRFP